MHMNGSTGYHFLKHKCGNSELLWILCAWKIYSYCMGNFYRLDLDIEFSDSFSLLLLSSAFMVCHGHFW